MMKNSLCKFTHDNFFLKTKIHCETRDSTVKQEIES